METMTVFAGTVFGDVFIWAPSLNAGRILKTINAHNGAVFSIAVNPTEKIISTTSDDRAAKVWSVCSIVPLLFPQDWESSCINLRHQFFGHNSRVWSSLILEEHFLTSGEDSKLVLWRKSGVAERVLILHQQSGIRGLHHSPNGMIITGGEDGGINAFSSRWLTRLPKEVNANVIDDTCTKVCMTNQGIVYVANGSCTLENEVIYKNDHFGSYSVIEVSPKYIFMGSIQGRLVVLDLEKKSVHIDLDVVDGRIYSIHWLDDRVLTCGKNGRLDLWRVDGGLENIKTMTLPSSRERWVTCAVIRNEMLILGDRKGSIYVFDSDSDPVTTFSAIHFEGVTDILATREGWLSVGRDGTLKTFVNQTHCLTQKLPMDWPWRIVPHDNDNLILGFHGISFIVWSTNNREIIASHNCGGGHRPYDFQITNNELTFLYVTRKKVQTVNLTIGGVTRIRNGYHGKEINCLEILQTRPTIVVSGSEDTTVRISEIKNDIRPLHVLEAHKSSVRAVLAVAMNSQKYFIVSVGGKDQIVIHFIDLIANQCKIIYNYFLTNKENDWKTPSTVPEIRIMCVDITEYGDGYVMATGCSDCQIHFFGKVSRLLKLQVIPYTHCILNIKFVQGLLASMATDGKVVFWDYVNGVKVNSFKVHQSGINSFQFKRLKRGKFILATGGDDNLFSVAGVEIRGKNVKLTELWKNSVTHSCQITGMKILRNYMITASVDQRITVWKWAWRGEFKMEFLNQFMTAVPDVQGMDVAWCGAGTLMAIVYGKGMQTVKIYLR